MIIYLSGPISGNPTYLDDADAIMMLDGWESSRGARTELAVARAIGLRVLNPDLTPHRLDGPVAVGESIVGLTDFRGDVIRLFQSAGWIFHGECTIWKDPQAQSIRTKAFSLAFQTKNRDSAHVRPALADYLLIFRKPGDNAAKIPHDAKSGEVTNDDWIQWAREDADERHICPLQLEFIRRCVLLYSNPGETVLTPFLGVGSEAYVAVQHGRRAIGCELKPSYWRTAVSNLRSLESELHVPSLFDDES